MDKTAEQGSTEGHAAQGCCGGGRGARGVGKGDPAPMKGMMDQMGRAGGPMAMMQKMMGPMGKGEGAPPMQEMMGMCMGMCAEMLDAVRQTNALAVFATPELQKTFADWMKGLEAKTAEIIAKGEADGIALAAALEVSEDSANYILGRLAAAGKVTLSAKPRS